MQEGVGDGAGARHLHALPARRPSVVHREANSLAGDLHTTEPTKKDAKEVLCHCPAMQYVTVSMLSITFGIIQGEQSICPTVYISFMGVNAALSLAISGRT